MSERPRSWGSIPVVNAQSLSRGYPTNQSPWGSGENKKAAAHVETALQARDSEVFHPSLFSLLLSSPLQVGRFPRAALLFHVNDGSFPTHPAEILALLLACQQVSLHVHYSCSAAAGGGGWGAQLISNRPPRGSSFPLLHLQRWKGCRAPHPRRRDSMKPRTQALLLEELLLSLLLGTNSLGKNVLLFCFVFGTCP